MKRVLIFGLFLFSAVSHAEDKSSGCGLGWKVTSRNSLLSSYTRSITNASTSSTSGMTSGTSGCDRHSIVKQDMKDIHFAESNFHSLMMEMAKGQGDYLKGFAMVMGCSEQQAVQFANMSQRNYQILFPVQGTTPYQLVNDVRDVMVAQGVCSSQNI